ncbi:cysteine--1-D-myo-inosityl 2-amino-2-deoxy-alpha-D-glucopyranoside ligase [Corynebacterium sp. zg-331]|uniref:cysteine--1-D-myo-inosityl 2-amino-2-deoxy-alpha-D-glucopyranoside ligase n=1 Tax=unclassified Corynebacterium TaxID=2624378 RepID=UPI00128C925C|nr:MULTISPECIES: cysteine--1-D-myo-inosityl 2-amino-2-deoxy-alpha-D-glucopyranoside ligase [unclassified Corynebacterium]MBC3185553.1 cysteine--1-D-myo-inosityl 2-amino-2-deoxy-alpha-D-glucopyranoside ligase [Corynebacterium sp. zg-331]MPV52047.1 cysteine--1-D-myo-inosityl 2-amino-2-deoxy-alpha-D-glucopyranoside ligase [Corynebacterium sp. zg331]
MHSWPSPSIPPVPGPPVTLRLYDTADQAVREVEIPEDGPVGVYVCGITPYDSTHLGHAATYLTFDLIHRVLLDNGHAVHYVQNITDVDDPLFERADRDGVDWRDLGTAQIDKFRGDMETLSVIPPQDYVGAMESVDEVIEMVSALLDRGAAYTVDDPRYPDVYASVDATEHFGYESNYSGAQMEKFFAERGGDPERPGKVHSLDALVWRAQRPGEPAWDSPFGPGRPGWHIECSAIATNRLGSRFAVQGGGSDLIFPHHEFSAAHAESALDIERMAGHYVHAGMMALAGTKMSKSLGNLVFVSDLVRAGHDPSAIRLGIFSAHYRSDRDWSEEVLATAERRLAYWREAARRGGSPEHARAVVAEVRQRLADDLDTPGALAAIDEWARTCSDEGQGSAVEAAVEALLGVRF